MPSTATIATPVYTCHAIFLPSLPLQLIPAMPFPAITATPAYHGLAILLPISLPDPNSLFTLFLHLSHIINIIFILFTVWNSTANAIDVNQQNLCSCCCGSLPTQQSLSRLSFPSTMVRRQRSRSTVFPLFGNVTPKGCGDHRDSLRRVVTFHS